VWLRRYARLAVLKNKFTARLPCLPNEMFAQFNEKPIYLGLHLFHRGEILKSFHRGCARDVRKCLKFEVPNEVR
jgi:hypothetical protein